MPKDYSVEEIKASIKDLKETMAKCPELNYITSMVLALMEAKLKDKLESLKE